MSDEKTSISIKIGDSEFSAEGPSELVNAQFEAFLKAVANAPAVQSRKEEPVTDAVPSATGTSTGEADNGTPTIDGIDDALINRVFQKDADGRVSLKVLPAGDTDDAFLLVLYGLELLTGEDHVTGGTIIKGLEKSGIKTNRVDRYAPPEWVTASGLRRGKRYGLNNQGKLKAIEILKGILK